MDLTIVAERKDADWPPKVAVVGSGIGGFEYRIIGSSVVVFTVVSGLGLTHHRSGDQAQARPRPIAMARDGILYGAHKSFRYSYRHPC